MKIYQLINVAIAALSLIEQLGFETEPIGALLALGLAVLKLRE